jgi:hypothetical protein
MEPTTVSASISITEPPDCFGPGPVHDAYLATATGLMRGATVLAVAPPSESAWAFALVSGQVLECSLKAFLSKDGATEKDLRDVGHNLSELWARAVKKRLAIGDMPQWAERLNSLHDRPYYLRYPGGLNVLVLTDAQQTESELRNLIDTVRKRMEAM